MNLQKNKNPPLDLARSAENFGILGQITGKTQAKIMEILVKLTSKTQAKIHEQKVKIKKPSTFSESKK